jgi:hypothetical protein
MRVTPTAQRDALVRGMAVNEDSPDFTVLFFVNISQRLARNHPLLPADWITTYYDILTTANTGAGNGGA